MVIHFFVPLYTNNVIIPHFMTTKYKYSNDVPQVRSNISADG